MSSYGLWLSAAGMKVQEHRQNVYANNLANMGTTGFKQDLAVITQRPVAALESPASMGYSHRVFDALAGGINVRPTVPSFEQGPLEWTGRSLDVALDGPGMFTVSDGAVTRYTRDGVFTTNREGELVLSSGGGRWRVLDDGGARIRIDETGEPIRISETGQIRQGTSLVATLAVSAADDEQRLHKEGENLFSAAEGVMKPATARTVSEHREESNVDAMTGLVSMIEASRAYQLNANLVQLQDQLTGEAVTRVGRLS